MCFVQILIGFKQQLGPYLVYNLVLIWYTTWSLFEKKLKHFSEKKAYIFVKVNNNVRFKYSFEKIIEEIC